MSCRPKYKNHAISRENDSKVNELSIRLRSSTTRVQFSRKALEHVRQLSKPERQKEVARLKGFAK